MTRETKVGLVVATSFLGLVGVVVAARMSSPENAEKKTRLADAQTAGNKKKPKESASTTENNGDDKKDGKVTEKAVIPATHETPGKPSGEPITIDLNSISNPTPPTIETKPAVAPPPIINDPVAKEVKKQVQLAHNDPPGTPPSLVASGPETKPETKPEATPSTTKPETKPESALPTTKPETKPESALPTTKPETKPESTPSTTRPEGPGPLAKPDPIAPAQGSNPDPGTKPQVSPPPLAPANDGKPPATTVTPIPTEVKPPAVADSKPPSAPPAPIGAIPSVTSPPIAVVAAGQTNNTLPQVKQYDINAYSIKPEDRSFADISQNLYGNAKYAQALVLFNRDHPQATEGIRQEPPQLRPGTPIFFPPKEILESKYASTLTSPTPPSPANSSPASVLGSPTPLTAVTPGNPSSVAAPPPGTNVWTEAGGGKNYRVGNNPEHIREIARTVLGDPEKWSEIYRLNHSVDPAYPIPAGTVLKLP